MKIDFFMRLACTGNEGYCASYMDIGLTEGGVIDGASRIGPCGGQHHHTWGGSQNGSQVQDKVFVVYEAILVKEEARHVVNEFAFRRCDSQLFRRLVLMHCTKRQVGYCYWRGVGLCSSIIQSVPGSICRNGCQGKIANCLIQLKTDTLGLVVSLRVIQPRIDLAVGWANKPGGEPGERRQWPLLGQVRSGRDPTDRKHAAGAVQIRVVCNQQDPGPILGREKQFSTYRLLMTCIQISAVENVMNEAVVAISEKRDSSQKRIGNQSTGEGAVDFDLVIGAVTGTQIACEVIRRVLGDNVECSRRCVFPE